jgi:membrane protease YdiL (CAAX protease family)
MNFLRHLKISNESKPLTSLLILAAILLCSIVLAQIVGAGLMIIMAGINLDNIGNMMEILMESKRGWWTMMVAQGISSVISFIVPGLLFWYAVEKKTFADLSFRKLPPYYIFGLVVVIQLLFSPFSGFLQSINEKVTLPSALKGLEEIMKSLEESAKVLTGFLTKFDTHLEFFSALLVIAVTAGIGEELIFRGLIQRKLLLITNNPHAAIWIAAAIFSAIHFQFYGFLPRLVLGALMGYLYYYSGNIWIPIFAHIFNNGLAVILMHLVNQKKISPEIEKLDTVPMPYVIISSVLCAGLLYIFKKKTEQVELS